mmetsp:Transcript_42133/g.101567  ORF Transcript_42133/g.101567 Transcript_42133/m.101567 type:complete len:96 (+) Transcript_42133:814-1101(+)
MWTGTIGAKAAGVELRQMLCTRDLSLVHPAYHPREPHSPFETGGAVRVFEVSLSELGDVRFEGWKSFRYSLLRSMERSPQALTDLDRWSAGGGRY